MSRVYTGEQKEWFRQARRKGIVLSRPRHVVHSYGPEYRWFPYYEYRRDQPNFDTLYLPRHSTDKPTFVHEHTHVTDRKHFTDDDRRKISIHLGYLKRRWFWGDWDAHDYRQKLMPVEEILADTVAAIAMGYIRDRKLLRMIKYAVNRKV